MKEREIPGLEGTVPYSPIIKKAGPYLIVADVQAGTISIGEVKQSRPHGPRKRWAAVFWRDGKPIRVEIPAGGARCGHDDCSIAAMFQPRAFPGWWHFRGLRDHMAECPTAWACPKRRRLLEDAGIELPPQPMPEHLQARGRRLLGGATRERQAG